MVFLSDDFKAGVFLGVFFENSFGIVDRAIVNSDDFEILIGLVDDGIEAFRKIFGGVVDWDDDGNFNFWVHEFYFPLLIYFFRKQNGRRKRN